MTSVRRALVLSLIERHLLIAIALAGSMVLARLLTPEEIGLYSVSLAVIGIAQVMREFGVGNFLIQRKELHEDDVRTTYGVSLLIGALLFAPVAALAPAVARFYDDMRLVDTLRISALNFLVLPFCTISVALLRREMQFQRLLYVMIAAAVVGLAITVGGALVGWGAASMAIGMVASNATTGFGAWLARGRPRLLVPSLSRWREVARFGAQTSAAGVVTSVSMDVNDLVVGKVVGFGAVAMLSRGQGLAQLFSRDIMGAVRNVALPAFAHAHRTGAAVEPIYVKSVASVCLVAWPFFGFVALFALEILRLMFGPQWDAAAPLARTFCLAGAIYATSSLVHTLVLAVGRNDIVTASELIFQPLRALLIVAAVMATGSVQACAWAYVAAFVVYMPFVYWMKGRCIDNDFSALLKALASSAVVSLVALAPALLMVTLIGFDRREPVEFALFCAAALSTALAWLGAVIVFKHPIRLDPLFQRITRRALLSH